MYPTHHDMLATSSVLTVHTYCLIVAAMGPQKKPRGGWGGEGGGGVGLMAGPARTSCRVIIANKMADIPHPLHTLHSNGLPIFMQKSRFP